MTSTPARYSSAFLVALFAFAACGGAGGRDIVAPRDISGGGSSPSIARIVDLGDLGAIPASGALPTDAQDGVFVVGELVLIEGSDFGKQPTVAIGGRPTSILARTGNGGIVSRIPAEVPTGTIAVEVSHPGGRSKQEIALSRHVAAVDHGGGSLYVASLDANGAVGAASRIAIPGARSARFVASGEVLLIAVDGSADKEASMAVVAMAAKGGPRLERSMSLGVRGTVRFFTMAARGSHGVVAVGDKLVFIDASLGRHPAVGRQVPAGEVPVAGALSPEGERLAVLFAERNAIIVADVARPLASLVGTRLSLLPLSRVPLMRAVAFSPDGKTAWTVAGDSTESKVAGHHPTALQVVGGTAMAPVLEGAINVAGAMAPVAITAAHRDQTLSAAAIRSMAARTPLLLATRASASLDANADYLALLAIGTALGQVVHADLEGNARVVAEGPYAFGDVAIAHDGAIFAASAQRLRAEQGTLRAEVGLLVGKLEGAAPRFVRLGDGTGNDPFATTSVAIAP